MKQDELRNTVQSYFNNTDSINTELLIKKLKPVIKVKCDAIRKEKKDSIQASIFTFFCILALFIGFLILFPDYIDYSNELLQFTTLVLVIGFFAALVFLLTKALFVNKPDRKDAKLRGRLL